MPATMTKKREDWPRLIERLHKRTGKTHAQLAAEVGVSLHTWHAWRYGKRSPSKTAARLLKILYFRGK